MLCIWGAGDKGGRIFRHLEEDEVVAFVDTNINKIGGNFAGSQ